MSAKWTGGWRNFSSGRVRIKFLTGSEHWGIYLDGKMVARRPTRDIAKRAAAKLYPAEVTP